MAPSRRSKRYMQKVLQLHAHAASVTIACARSKCYNCMRKQQVLQLHAHARNVTHAQKVTRQHTRARTAAAAALCWDAAPKVAGTSTSRNPRTCGRCSL